MSRTAALGMPIRGPEAAGAVSWQGYVKDKDLTAPPGSPVLDDRYIVTSVATGAWATHEDDIAEWDGSQWIFSTPDGGWAVWVEDEGEIYVWNGSSWGQESFGLHAATHEDGGADEISVAALSGLLADAQTPLAHAATHKGGGADVIDAATSSLAGLMAAVDKAKLDALFVVIKTGDNIKTILEAATDNSFFYLENGTHTTTGLITISSKKNITIFGGPGATVTRSGSEKIFKIEGCQDFRMEGFSVSVTGTSGSIIDITNAGAGSYQTPTRHSYTELHFDVPSGDVWGCINVSQAFLQGSIVDCTFSTGIGNAVSLLSSDASGTVIARNRVVSTYSGGTAIDLQSSSGVGLLVGDNYIEGPFSEAIQLGTSTGAIIRDNTLRGMTSKGIDANANADRAVIKHNIVYDSGGRGIQCSSDYAIIQGNEIYSAAADGIELLSSTETHVVDNILENGAAYGLSLDAGSTSCTVGNNHFASNASGDENIVVEFQRPDGTFINPLLQTTDATVTTIKTISIPDDTSVWIEADVINRQTNAAERGKWKRGALVYREAAGSATKEGSTWTPLTIKSVIPALWDVDIVVSGDNALIQVTGAVGDNINWESRHSVEERS